MQAGEDSSIAKEVPSLGMNMGDVPGSNTQVNNAQVSNTQLLNGRQEMTKGDFWNCSTCHGKVLRRSTF
jgi:hypothetical protein